jgi:hypothetical protein
MELNKIDTLPPPPGVVGSLKAGFDAIAANLAVILLPLALDLLLWLGPRLRVDKLFQPLFDEISRYAGFSGIPVEDLQSLQENSTILLEQIQQYNLLSALRTFPIGVFSLMSKPLPNQTPLGLPVIIQLDSILTMLGLVIVLSLIGWMSGGLFFHWVSTVVTDQAKSKEKPLGRSVVQTILISILYLILAAILGTPVLLMLGLVITTSPLLAQGFLLILGLLSMWLIVPLFFTPHGIFLRQQNAFSSIFASLKMARFTLPTSSMFVLSVILIGYGLNYLWNIPSPESWMALVGIAGHAFISTSLLAASFIYYRDMQVWLQTVLEKLKTNFPTQQA